MDRTLRQQDVGELFDEQRIDDGGRPWRVAVTFADLTQAEEDRLVRFAFARQRELRAREAGAA